MTIAKRIKAAMKILRSGNTYWEYIMNGMESASGIDVNADSALQYSAVFAAMVLITETMGSVPGQVFKRTDDGREIYRDHPVYKILHDQANRLETAQQFRERFHWDIEMRGLAVAEKVYNGRGLAELWKIDYEDIGEIRREGSRLIFSINGKEWDQNKLFYVYGPGQYGVTPRSRLTVARDAMGLGLAMQKYGSNFFKNGTNVGATLEHPGQLGKEAYDRLKQAMEDKYSGSENSHKSMILEEGMKLTRSNMSNEDSQFLESRKFQIADIARFFGVKSHMIGDLERATFSNIEQQGIEAVTYCWRPRATRFEQAVNMQLLSQKNTYFEHNLNGLMQGDLKSQAEAWHIMLQDGVMNADEVRGLLNMNNQPDGQGQVFLAPLNMVNKEQITDPDMSDVDEAKTTEEFKEAASSLIPSFKRMYEEFNEDYYIKQIHKVIGYQEKRAEKGLDLDVERERMKKAFKVAAYQASME